MSQEEIDAYIASVAPDEDEAPQKQAAAPEDADSGGLSQGDIDALFGQQPEEELSPGVRQDSGAVSQSEIDKLVSPELQAQRPQGDQVEGGEDPPVDFDAGDSHQQEEVLETQELDRCPDDADTGPVLKAQSGLLQDKDETWDGLGSDILSQDEINALLFGLNDPEDAPACPVDTKYEDQKNAGSEPVTDIPLNRTKSSIQRQKEKEEQIIQKKTRASAMIRELLKAEQARIANLQMRKNKMVNEDLYARYEITRADRTKITVSMSEKTAAQYHASHPGCTMYKI